ncbi:MAG: AAA family ATPase [Bacteroidales bacterium]|nr:AAA family ATPase [Bacteroidales bacterium]
MNPFKFGTIVEGDFFTDRVEETAVLLQKLDSENHIVLISPRRFGKSSLVQKVLSQVDRPQIRIDLQYVMSVDDLAAQLLKAIFKIYPMEKVRHAMTHFRIAPTLSMNAVTGAMEVSFQPTANASVLLEDAMAVLEKVTTAENRFIVVLDEFQEVVKIQKGLDRQLRSLMQRQHNLNYILLGSQESMMEAIFEKKTSPFYHFGQMIRMGKIPYDDFHKYITDRIDAEGVADEILQFTACHPYYTQQLASQVWEMTRWQVTHDGIVEKAVVALVEMHDLDYERLWQNMNRTDRYILKLLALSQMPMQNRSKASSTSYSSLLRLMKAGYVVRAPQYEIEDPFFRRWILKNVQ